MPESSRPKRGRRTGHFHLLCRICDGCPSVMSMREPSEADITLEELQLAARNHGQPLEALRYPLTPIGLHYLLIHYDIPSVEVNEWRLTIDGRVRRELSLRLDDLREMPAQEVAVTMECAGNGRARLAPRAISQPWLLEAIGTGSWRGVSLRALLDEAGLEDDAAEILFTGLDRGVENEIEQHYARSLPLAEAARDEVVLAYELNGVPLPPQHGYPLRLVVPGWYGMTNVKWLDRITVLSEPFGGYQQAHAYRFRRDADDEGTPLTRMAPRSLMVPPGIPDFMTRERVLRTGTCIVTGRAWSGWGPIVGVELSLDGGSAWAPAKLEEAELGEWAWHAWSFLWQPEQAGTYELACRATDAAGNTQPLEPTWNVGGYSNNAVHRVTVTVTDG